MNLSDIKPGMRITGLVSGVLSTIIAVERFSASVTVVYRTDEEQLGQVLISEKEAARLVPVSEQRWTFDSDGEMFRLASEARRIQLAHLTDPYTALSEAAIDPLPHQIEAVYQRLLPVKPLRFLLADDPGAGKTIMSGLLIKELLMREAIDSCLIVVPGGLIDQWQAELREKFGLSFEILTPDRSELLDKSARASGRTLLLARMDQMARNDALLAKLSVSEWDLAIVDEAHKMSASRFKTKIKKTKRFRLGEELREVASNLLLLTATPHNGKNNDFLVFLTLLDKERFGGKLRYNEPLPDISDIMRRTVKENLLTFEGKPLFPERKAQTLTFSLSDREQLLYEKVTQYVREGFNRVDQLLLQGDRQANAVGFVLTMLQRRLASSPAAIHESLKRRRGRLEGQLHEQLRKTRARTKTAARVGAPRWGDDPDSWDDYNDAEIEKLEADLADARVGAATLRELQEEVAELHDLERLAEQVRVSGVDRKWEELAKFLRSGQFSGDKTNKLIVFTEHKDTLSYLVDRIRGLTGQHKAVLAIHGGVPAERRRDTQDTFANNPAARVLVATDAAGEGVNLQCANLMVNYDLPWNPNRIEQRFGRIHRIGQTKPCFLWNLVAESTREGKVFQVLLNKIEQQRQAYGGRVYDTLGDRQVNKSLREQLLKAIRYGDDPEVIARMEQVIDSDIGGRVNDILKKDVLAEHGASGEDFEAVKDLLERAQARKLQPGFVEAFFLEALRTLGGRAPRRGEGLYEVTRVPLTVRTLERQASVGGRVRRWYERVTFRKDIARPGIGRARAMLIAPGHPLLSALTETILEAHGDTLKTGATLVDESDSGLSPRVLVYFVHSVVEHRQRPTGKHVVSQRFQFVEVSENGETTDPGTDPYLNYEALDNSERELVEANIDTAWADTKVAETANGWAVQHLAFDHYEEVSSVVSARVNKKRAAVTKRINREIQHWDRRVHEHKKQIRQLQKKATRQLSRRDPKRAWLHENDQTRFKAELTRQQRKLLSAQKRAEDLVARKDRRLAELNAEDALLNQPPIVAGAALVIPRGLLDKLSGAETDIPDPETRAEIDRRAVAAVMATERALGREPEEQKHNNPGFDILSRDPSTGIWYQLEVKGHRPDTPDIKVSMVQVRQGKQNPERFRLVVVEVPKRTNREPWVRYFERPFDRHEPHFAQGYLPLRVADLPIIGTQPR